MKQLVKFVQMKWGMVQMAAMLMPIQKAWKTMTPNQVILSLIITSRSFNQCGIMMEPDICIIQMRLVIELPAGRI